MKRFYVIKTKYIPYLFFSAMNFLNKSFLEKLSPQSFTITITNCQNVKEVDNLQLGEKKFLVPWCWLKSQNPEFCSNFQAVSSAVFPLVYPITGTEKRKKQVCKVYYAWDQIHLLLKDGPDGPSIRCVTKKLFCFFFEFNEN